MSGPDFIVEGVIPDYFQGSHLSHHLWFAEAEDNKFKFEIIQQSETLKIIDHLKKCGILVSIFKGFCCSLASTKTAMCMCMCMCIFMCKY